MIERKKDKEKRIIYVSYKCDSCKKGQLRDSGEKDFMGRYKNICDQCGKSFWKLTGYPYLEVM